MAEMSQVWWYNILAKKLSCVNQEDPGLILASGVSSLGSCVGMPTAVRPGTTQAKTGR